MKTHSIAWIFTTALLLSPGIQAKEAIYKWTDDKGVVHYSSHPPAGQKAEKVKVYGSKGTSIDVAAKPSKKTAKTEKVAAEAKPEPPQPPAAIEPPPNRKDPKLCEQAKKNLWNLENYPRLRIQDPETGQRRVMSSEEKEQYMSEAKQQVAEFCDQ